MSGRNLRPVGDHLQDRSRLSPPEQRQRARSATKTATAGKHMMRATLISMLALILGKITGQLREILAGNRFGFGYLTDAYLQGFLIPDFLYEILIGGSIQAVIVPTLAGALGTKKEQKTWRSVSIFISVASLTMLTAVILGELLAPQVMALFTRQETHGLASKVARILFPQTFLMMLAALTVGILNAHKQFHKTAFGPVLYNCLIVIFLLVQGRPSEEGVLAVATGIVLSALAYFLFQVVLGRRELRPFRPLLDLQDQGFRRLVRLAVPTLLSSSIPQLNYIILNTFMKSLPEGTPTALRYANTLWMLPWGVFAVAIGNVLLPSLSEAVADRKGGEASRLLSDSLKRALFLTFPCALIFFFMRSDVVRGVFQWSARSVGDDHVQLTANMLAPLCLTIVSHTVVPIMIQAFYAVKKTFFPLLNSLISLLATAVFGFVFSREALAGPSGLSVGYALGSLLGAAFLFIAFRRLYPVLAPRGLVQELLRLGLAGLGIVGVLLPLMVFVPGWNPVGKSGQLLWLLVRSGLAFVAYLAVGYLVNLQSCCRFVAFFSHKLGRLKGRFTRS